VRELVVRIPDVDAFLALAPEELAAKMLFLMREANRADFHRDSLENELWGSIGSTGPSYPRSRSVEVHLAFAEAWAWLEAQGLLVPAEGINGTNGFRHLSRRARQFASDTDFADYRIARLIPRDILNARIAAKPARNESMGAIRRQERPFTSGSEQTTAWNTRRF
jgi:hypothetical protein